MQRVDRMIARIDGSAMRHYLLIASPVIAVFFIIPMQLFLNGRGYVDWSRLIPAGFVLAGLCAYLILAAAVWVLLKGRPRWAYLFSTAMFWLGLYVLLSFVFVPPKITLLDGRPLLSSQPLNRTIEQAVLFLLAAVAAFRVRSHRTSAFGLFTVAFLLVVSLSYGALVAASGHPAAHAADARRNTAVSGDISHGVTGRPDTTIRGNVYHIVLDEMQGNVALARLRDKRNADAFPGFTFFKNTISNYLYTYQSFHSYFTGTVYDAVDYAKWVDGYKTGGLLNDLQKRGYRITEYTPAFLDFARSPSVHLTSEEVFREKYGSPLYSIKDFTQIWLARVMPNFGTNAALAAGRSLGARIEASLEGPSYAAHVPTSDDEGIHPFSAVLTVERAMKDEPKRAAAGEYVYLHALVPHEPYVLDDECRYRPAWKAPLTRRYDAQTGCAINLVSRYLAMLRALGRYDDATIIIQSDHGSNLGPRGEYGPSALSAAPAEENGGLPFADNQTGWSKSAVRGRIMATLMIKPARSVHPFAVSEEPAQLLDVYPSLAALLGMKAGQKEMAGRDLFDDAHAPGRRLSFYVTPNEVDKPPGIVVVDVANPRDLLRSPLTVREVVRQRRVAYLPEKGLSVDIGAPGEEGVWLQGFFSKEEEPHAGGTIYSRWAGGKESTVKFLGVQVRRRTRLLLDFDIEPFLVMRNRKILVKSPLTTAEVIVKPGWNSYRVALEFPAGEEITVTIGHEKSASLRALGLNNNDERELAVHWRKIGVSYAPPGMPRANGKNVS